MFKIAIIAVMTVLAMIALSFAHPSSYEYNAQKGRDAKGYEYSASPAPVYGSGYDKTIYGEYEGHPGLYKETKGY
ncbi:uncharacterized protein LOC116917556 [Daphnia magna]|uniref:Uncharacterized protein n=2 Tax=Daphnia magna TaxID=35525 RepID=A0A164XMH7_9CRUS|nr:uncharacterized protein LOC116917556 [Daphnia magna]KAK4020088.1 hypothetical protein OUZ56_002084 [Daphnia magna]KZS14385.1 Uncharacterized protein APZ42_020276 [Daphnia magna]